MEWEADSLPNAGPNEAVRPATSGRTFSLRSLFLLVTVFSLWMGLAVTLPDVAFPGLILLGPVIVRGIAENFVARRPGHRMTLAEIGAHFYYSFLVVVLIYMIAFGTLMMLTFAGVAMMSLLAKILQWELSNRVFEIGMIVLLVSVFGTTGIFSLWLYWRWWPRKGKRPW
jgi:hypothetical protein